MGPERAPRDWPRLYLVTASRVTPGSLAPELQAPQSGLTAVGTTRVTRTMRTQLVKIKH